MTRTGLHRATEDGVSALALWFKAARDISGEDASERDAVLDDIYGFTQFAIHGELVLLGTERGRALLKPHDDYPESVLTIVYAPRESEGDGLVTFWMNRTSLADLTTRLGDQGRGEAVEFDDLLAHEQVGS